MSAARSRSAWARSRAASRCPANAGHAPPNTVTPTAVNSTMRSTRSKSARSWLATTIPPCQRSSSAATAARPSASRLLVGSSSSSTSGASIMSRASATRVRSPPLSEAIGRSSGSAGRDVSASAVATRASSVQSARVGIVERAFAPLEPPQSVESIGDAERLGNREALICRLRERTDRARTVNRSAGRVGVAADHTEQRRLAATVASDQAGPLALQSQASGNRIAGGRQGWRGISNPG